MIQTLKQFTNGTRLFDAVSALLSKLNIMFDRETAEPIAVADLYDGTMPKYLTDVLQNIDETYYIGLINDLSLTGDKSGNTLADARQNSGRYDGMFVFACDAKTGSSLTRTAIAALTRAFNRIASANPVILVLRQENLLTLSTCERSTYQQSWRQGEKVGKVTMLRGINCTNPHRGHINILNSMQVPANCSYFDALYEHWKKVFSSELLTKAFYNELSDWYAWATKVMKFPNALGNDTDDQKYNAENAIRLVTRLIFIWFLKEKKLVPEEFFDVNEVKKLIKDFDPSQREGMFNQYVLDSKYYQAILQNLFFAMLNCPITEDGNALRGFRKYDEDGKAIGTGRGDSRLMRYKDYFSDADAFLALAQKVPFLNGGLFDCLDDPDKKFYLDGFSDNKEVRKALCVPNFLFFGENSDIDLSEWYDDKQKKHIKVRGIIDILKNYQFTIEENTPYEQEVSLDPELLGKVFENLLASYNPETQTTARKSTGSYYTPREIVQYMVDESLIAYLKEKVDDSLENQYRQLLDYNDAEDTLALTEEQKQAIMSALYHCKVLDPACGSGAFPMGMLQQMVHVMSKLDGDNRIWKNVIETKLGQELASTIGHSEEERQELQNDINRNFDLSQNEPDYARKLYLIENCIYGVDIQTIAIQISKLRCFISLVVDQKVNDDPTDNFGIRPLPNLEARFVAANSLIGLKNDLSLADTEGVHKVREELAEANHRIFNAKTLKTKRKWRSKVEELRGKLVDELKQTGFVTDDDASLIASWDPFNQNCSSRFFDPEWMFGFKKFDIVIGNPPYINAKSQVANHILAAQRKSIIKSKKYISLYKKWDLYIPFIELGIQLTSKGGVVSMIVPYPLTNQPYGKKLREMIIRDYNLFKLCDLNGTKIFENAEVSNCIPFIRISKSESPLTVIGHVDGKMNIVCDLIKTADDLVPDGETSIWNVTQEKCESNRHANMHVLGDFCYISVGMVLNADEKSAKGEFKKEDLISDVRDNIHCKAYIEAKDIDRYVIQRVRYLEYNTDRVPNKIRRPTFPELYDREKILTNKIGELKAVYDSDNLYCDQTNRICILWKDLIDIDNKSIQSSIKKYSTVSRMEMENLSRKVDIKYLLAILNSKYGYKLLEGIRGFGNIDVNPEYIRNIPIPIAESSQHNIIVSLVDRILSAKKENPQADTSALEAEIDKLVYELYGLTEEEIKVVAYVNLK